jgi:hypothetical protein
MGIIELDNHSFVDVQASGVVIYHNIWDKEQQTHIYEKLFIPFTKLERIRSEINRVRDNEYRKKRLED